MNTVTVGPEWRKLLSFIRYSLSPPSFVPDATPAVLTVAPAPGFARVRRFALLAIPFFMALVVLSAFGFGTVNSGDRIEAVLALVAAAALWAVLTILPKRLLARFADGEVTVQEGGIRAPRWQWTAPIASFSGLAWHYHAVTQWYMKLQLGETTEYRRRAAPVVTEYHWIELVHPGEPAKTLILHLQKGDAGMRERLDRYSRSLGRPIIAERVEDRLT